MQWIYHRQRVSDVRVGRVGILSPHGALTCLYGVSDSRASPRLFVGGLHPELLRIAPLRGANPLYMANSGWRTKCLP